MFKYFLISLILSSALLVHPQSDFAVGVNGNINFPNGQFADFKTGYGGDAHFLYLLGNYSILSLTIGYNKFDLDVDAFNDRANELGFDAEFKIESHFSTIPILVGAKYYFIQQKKHSPYIMIEAGLYDYQFSFKGTITEIAPGGSSIQSELPEIDESGTETMLKISAGYIYFFNRQWFVDASVGYAVLVDAFTVNKPVDPDDPDAVYGAAETLNYISVLAGINYRF
jgi:hypothetical protein